MEPDHGSERLGESKTRHADVRIIAATHRDLRQLVEAGQFREVEHAFVTCPGTEIGLFDLPVEIRLTHLREQLCHKSAPTDPAAPR